MYLKSHMILILLSFIFLLLLISTGWFDIMNTRARLFHNVHVKSHLHELDYKLLSYNQLDENSSSMMLSLMLHLQSCSFQPADVTFGL